MGAAQSTSTATTPPLPSACPVNSKDKDRMNALNNIPLDLNSSSSPDAVNLSNQRTLSSIPRSVTSSSNSDSISACPVKHSPSPSTGTDDDNWVYPSPQQFQNALARKGKAAPLENVSMMVEIHNWMNEKAWDQVRRWEEQRSDFSTNDPKIALARFQGRPQDLSPKARYHLMLGKLFPNTYSSTPPFDRHDWYIRRPRTGVTQRYVIDYYSAPNDDDGNPVFSLDVRPAIDSFDSMQIRLAEWARLKREKFFPSSTSTSATSSEARQ